jgi:hypothetical protein
MATNRKPDGYWTIDTLTEEARKYKSRTEFKNGSSGAYSIACRKGYIDRVCAHMTTSRKRSGYWNKQRVLKEARKYNRRSDFQNSDLAAYSAAYKHGWLDEVCGHMTGGYMSRGYWTKENVLKAARAYDTRTKFMRGSPRAYDVARKGAYLDEACAHMRRIGDQYRRCVYFIVADNDIYVGLTYDMKRRVHQRPHIAELKERGKYIQITPYMPVDKAVELEEYFRKTFDESSHWNCLNRYRGGSLGKPPRSGEFELIKDVNKKDDVVKGYAAPAIVLEIQPSIQAG